MTAASKFQIAQHYINHIPAPLTAIARGAIAHLNPEATRKTAP